MKLLRIYEKNRWLGRFFVAGGLLRLAAQKEDVKSKMDPERITHCIIFTHKIDYTKKETFCKGNFLHFFVYPVRNWGF